MITDWIGLHSVQLPLLITAYTRCLMFAVSYCSDIGSLFGLLLSRSGVGWWGYFHFRLRSTISVHRFPSTDFCLRTTTSVDIWPSLLIHCSHTRAHEWAKNLRPLPWLGFFFCTRAKGALLNCIVMIKVLLELLKLEVRRKTCSVCVTRFVCVIAF